MAEMTRRERIMTATHKKRADKLPFFSLWRHSQVGRSERECRNMDILIEAEEKRAKALKAAKTIEDVKVVWSLPKNSSRRNVK